MVLKPCTVYDFKIGKQLADILLDAPVILRVRVKPYHKVLIRVLTRSIWLTTIDALALGFHSIVLWIKIFYDAKSAGRSQEMRLLFLFHANLHSFTYTFLTFFLDEPCTSELEIKMLKWGTLLFSPHMLTRSTFTVLVERYSSSPGPPYQLEWC